MNDFIGDVVALAFGGQGVVRQDGFVIFVPFTAVGDRIQYRIVERKKRFATGELLNIVTPSPQRVKPLCPYFGTCGGCQLQHIDYIFQLEHKQQCVKEALERIGGLNVNSILPIVSAPRQWEYRRHVTLTLRDSSAGYIAVDNHSLLEVQQCPIFTNKSNSIISHLQTFVKRLKCSSESTGKVVIYKADSEKFILHFSFNFMPSNCAEECEKALSENENWAGIMVSAPKQNFSLGQTTISCEILGLIFEFAPGVFIQNYPEQSSNLYRYVCSIVEKLRPRSIVDLYCGIGITSLLLSKYTSRVLGVEWNRHSIQWAHANAERNSINHVSFLQADVQKVLTETLKREKPDFILLNPPRLGLDEEVTKILSEYDAKDIVYISCMPSTLGRDLKRLSSRYALRSCQPFDMFPQTAHVETVVHLSRIA